MQHFSVVILGGGAGGLELATGLARAGMKDLLLIDRSTHHVWKPRLHEIAAGLGRSQVNEIRYVTLAEKWGFAFQQGELADVLPDKKHIILKAMKDGADNIVVPQREIGYQASVLAIGGATPDLGVGGALQHALKLNNGDDADALFNRLSTGLLAHAVQGNEKPFEIVIVGSGTTGVELSAHLIQNYLCNTLEPRSELPEIHVTLLEATDQILVGAKEKMRQQVHKRLSDLGVQIKTEKQVSKVTSKAVYTRNGDKFPTDLSIWTTGTVGHSIADDISAFDTNEKRQWLVKSTLQTFASDAVFALGDCCEVADDPSPNTAQAASQQAKHLIKGIQSYLEGKRPDPFTFENKGNLLSLGQAGGIANIKAQFVDDIFINGNLARAAYHGLYRQHQYKVLGFVDGSKAMVSDIFAPGVSPRLKVHG